MSIEFDEFFGVGSDRNLEGLLLNSAVLQLIGYHTNSSYMGPLKLFLWEYF